LVLQSVNPKMLPGMPCHAQQYIVHPIPVTLEKQVEDTADPGPQGFTPWQSPTVPPTVAAYASHASAAAVDVYVSSGLQS